MAPLSATTEKFMDEFRLLTTDRSGKNAAQPSLLSASLHKARSKGDGRPILRIETSSSLADPMAAVGHLRFSLVLADPRINELARRDRIAMTVVQVVPRPEHPWTYFVELKCLEVPMDSHAIAWQLAVDTARRAKIAWTSLVDWIDVCDPRTPETSGTLPNGSFRPCRHAKVADRTQHRSRRRTTNVPPRHDASSDETSFASL